MSFTVDGWDFGPGQCELCGKRDVHRPDTDHPQRITARVCTECLGDGPWDHDEHTAQVSE